MTAHPDDYDDSRNAGAGRVLAIGGWGRCGSTLLDMMLGQVPGLVSAGEVRELWLHGCVEDRPCGCGTSFHTCPFWTKVGEAAFGGWHRLDLDRILRVRYSTDRPWGIPKLLRLQAGAVHEDLVTYGAALVRLFDGIRQVSGARVVIDSSKIPTHTMILSRLAGADVRLVHLVRDSRGVAYSNTKVVIKQVTKGPPKTLPRHGPVSASARYNWYNGLTALNRRDARYMLLRYEDLIAAPEPHLRAILRHAGEPDDVALPFLTPEGALLAENHLVDGNPVRFNKGAVPLRMDEEWRTRMAAKDRRTVTALTLPLLASWRYPIR